MKTVGRGRDYQKALKENLIRSLAKNKRITTTRTRARILQTLAGKRFGQVLTMTPLSTRRGDNAPQVMVELASKVEEKHEDTTNKNKRNTKKLAPR
jgi:ribosomal protein L17